MKVFSSTPCVLAAGELLQARAEHEEEEQRLDERGDDPDAVAAEADQLAPPDDLHRPQLAAPAARRDADADDLGRGGAGGGDGLLGGAHRRPPDIICIITRLACLLPDSSASRIVVPGVRHEDVVERRARHADRADGDAELGEQPRHELLAGGHEEGHGALGHRRLEAEALGQRGDGRVVVLGLDAHAIGADLRLERLGRVERDDLALVHDRDAIAELGLVHVVRGHEDRDLLALLQLGDVAPDRAARLRVEADRRLVEEEHARRVQEAARDLQAPAHAAGEGHHRRVAALPQPDHLEHLAHAVGDERGVDAVELGVQAQVLLGGQVAVERRVLEDEADVAADVVALAHDVVAGDARAARGRARERAEHVDRRRLAGAVGAEEPEDLAGGDLEAHAAHRLDLVEGLAAGRRPRSRV